MITIPVVRRMLTGDRRRLAVSLVGVAAGVGLVLLLQALWAGQVIQITSYEDNVAADLFVAQPGTESVLADVSVVPLEAVDVVAGIPGVERVDPVHLHYTVFDLNGTKEFVLLAGYRPGGLGGPWRLASGREPSAPGEAVLDRTLADEHGLALGDRLSVAGAILEVVGMSEETRSWMTSLVFVTSDTAAALAGEGATASYLLVTTATPDRTAAAVTETTGLDALSPATRAANDREVLAGIMEGPVLLMIGIAFAAATLVIALTVYSGVVERLREYGIIKAIGAPQGRVQRIVAGQTLFLSITGSLLGYLFYLAGTRLVQQVRPQFWFSLRISHIVTVAVAAVVMAAIAAVVPTRRLGRVDPASVYRGW